MPRAKPEFWSKPGIEHLDISDVWTRPQLLSLIDRHLAGGSSGGSAKRTNELIVDFHDVLGVFRASLHRRSKPAEGSVKAALAEVKLAAQRALNRLEALDDESKDRFASTANMDTDWRTQNPFDCPLGSSARALKRIFAWADGAMMAEGKSSIGAPLLEEEREAISGLLKIWGKACFGFTTHRYPPKAKDFSPFALRALAPIREKYSKGAESSLSSIIDEVLAKAPIAPIPRFATPRKE